MAGTRAPLEPKTQAAGLAGTVAGIGVWLLQTYAFKGNAVPAGLVSLIYAFVPGLLALGAAYLAPHQVRPGDTPPPLVFGKGGGGGGGGGGRTSVTAGGAGGGTFAGNTAIPPEPPPQEPQVPPTAGM